MVQLSLKKVLTTFKDEVQDSLEYELKQLHMCGLFSPCDPNKLTKEEKSTDLESHEFLERKRDHTVKGRFVSGGNKQRTYTSHKDVGSPTSFLECIFITSFIEAYERREVDICDIPNAFVQTDKEEDIIMGLRDHW